LGRIEILKILKIKLMNKKNNKKNQGFSIIEVMVCVTIILVTFTSIYTLINHSMVFHDLAYSKLTASYLAQEGIEIVRNIRDNNYIRNGSWNAGLNTGNYQVQYNSTSLSPYTGDNLKINSSGLYNYSDGETTRYNRMISIEKIGNNEIRVTSIVKWSNRGINFDIQVEDHLYNWY
jgi:prepilin-type N-terminal cleavage/methylation domain-containing protein